MRQPLRASRRYDRIAQADRRHHTGILLVGFIAVTAAIIAAYRSPASAYEVSIYAATPLAFWGGVAVALAAAIAVAFARPTGLYRMGALVLGGEAFLAIVALPIIRGYEFYSAGDALSHMGWVRNVLRGDLALVDLIYPGPHTIAIYVNQLLGLSVEQSMLLTVVFFAASFIVFVPLVVAVLSKNTTVAVVVGAFSAMLVLPINNISAHLVFFPSTMAIFFMPFVLLLMVVLLTDKLESRLTPVDGLLGLGALAVLFIHPQQTANLLLVFMTVSVTVLIHRYYTGSRSVNPLYGHTTIIALALFVWGISHERIASTAVGYANSVLRALFEGGTASGAAVSQRSGSLAAIGVSPLEIALKLFFPSLVFALLTVLVLRSSFANSLRSDNDHLVLAIIGLGFLPVGCIMALYVLANLQTIYFRHLGFIMALVTVFGAIALTRVIQSSAERGHLRSVVAVNGLVLALLLVLSMSTVFPSPFIYQPNSHVTESRMTGHETAFAHENPEISYVGIRTGPDRFRDGIEGTFDLDRGAVRTEARVPYGRLDGDLQSTFDGPRYLVVSRADVQRETVAYKNLRYSDRGFRTLDSRTGVDRVISNGDFRLYYVQE